jgi:hypothetical protein
MVDPNTNIYGGKNGEGEPVEGIKEFKELSDEQMDFEVTIKSSRPKNPAQNPKMKARA